MFAAKVCARESVEHKSTSPESAALLALLLDEHALALARSNVTGIKNESRTGFIMYLSAIFATS
jgi:hypothetical protein